MKLNYIELLLIIIITLILSGCQSTGVIPMDQDSYYIGKKDGSPGLGVSLSNKAAVYKEANAYCRDKGLEVKTIRETITPSRPGQLGSMELQFRCVSPGGSAQPLVKDADTVIEIKNH
ncbi:MAG: hypothetical protein AABZ15_01210 [Nitrospirota bacterium]